MLVSPETIVVLLALTLVLGPPVVCFVAMRRQGRAWTRTRVTAYTATALLYAINGAVLFARGNHTAGWISGLIAWWSGKGAWQAWRAYRVRDFRPAYMREKEAASVAPAA